MKELPNLPYSIEAEQSVLGSIILDKDVFIDAAENLKKDDFYSEQNSYIFDAMLTLYNKKMPIDLITLSETLKDKGTFEKCGGIMYLTNLSTAPAFTQNISSYIEIVKEKSILRKLINASLKTIQNCNSKDMQIFEILDQAEKSVFDVSQEKNDRTLVCINDILEETFDTISTLSSNEFALTGLTTGFADLDRKLNGLQKTDLILIAARPAMGKTAFSLNIAQNAAINANAKVAIFNLEMSKDQLIQRMISATGRIELNKIKTGKLKDEEWSLFSNSIAALKNTQIYIDDSPGITAFEIKSKCRRLKIEKGGLDLVLIDYLQLMESDSKSESRQQEISKISRSLKILAKELECPVIALSQLSRAPESRTDKRPMLSDLRESGAIEQDADLVMFLYRDDYYHRDSDQKNITEVIIAKHRHGEVGTVPLTWFGQYQLFKDNADTTFSRI